MKKVIFFIYFSIVISALLAAGPVISIQSLLFDYGSVKEGKKVESELFITNRGDEKLSVSLTAACNCLVAGENSFSLMPGEKKAVLLTFNTDGYSGEVMREFIIQSNDPANSLLFYQMKGTITGTAVEKKGIFEKVIQTNSFDLQRTDNKNRIYFFAYTSCKSCKPLLEALLKWTKKQNQEIKIYFYNLEDPVNKENLYTISDKLNNYSLKLPLVMYDSLFYGGKKEITAFITGKKKTSLEDVTRVSPFSALSVPAVFLYGLADGVNPCAFTLIILLVSYLTLQLKRKKQILYAGLLYICAVYVTYFLIGLGLFEFLRRMQLFPLVSTGLKYGLTGFLIILALLSLYDFFKAKNGKTDEMALKLPGFIQKSLRQNIRNRTKSTHIYTGSITLGITVSIFELGCTGQVYLPVLGYIIRSNPAGFKSLALLGLYNLAFIIPLASVFILVINGLSSRKIGDFFGKRLTFVKLLFFTLFILLAILNVTI